MGRGGGGKNVKRPGLGGCLLRVGCSGFYVHLQSVDYLVFFVFFLALFGELKYCFVRVSQLGTWAPVSLLGWGTLF